LYFRADEEGEKQKQKREGDKLLGKGSRQGESEKARNNKKPCTIHHLQRAVEVLGFGKRENKKGENEKVKRGRRKGAG